MRLTCLKCGHQMEVATDNRGVRLNCVCGQDYSYPEVFNTGTAPNEQAAERSRSRAFRAAGVVKNIGGFALGISLLGILFFPIALLGAGVGIYTLTMIRGPLGRYSGRRAAIAAVTLGAAVFLGEGALAIHWYKARQLQALRAVQSSVSEDLRALLRAERLFRATHDTYGTFEEFRFRPTSGHYTIYLAPDQVSPGVREGETITDLLPDGLAPFVSEAAFTAFAVANLDGDPFLDVWRLTDDGTIQQLQDDAANEVMSLPSDATEPGAAADGADAEPAPVEPPGEPAEPSSPTAPPAPEPEPAPAPEAAPKPEPVPAPAPKPEPVPAPAPKPEPEPTPAPEPEPVPVPAVKPEPAPAPAEVEIEFQADDEEAPAAP